MYNKILLTTREVVLLSEIIDFYKNNAFQNTTNAHIIQRHIMGQLPTKNHQNDNQMEINPQLQKLKTK
jgi:hypothetical protein